MPRTYYRKVGTSTEPSRANWDKDQPCECAGSGKKLRITRDAIVMVRWPQRLSWHASCFRV